MDESVNNVQMQTVSMTFSSSDQENCTDFLMPDGCDDENEYGAVPAARNVSSLNS